MPTSAPSRSTSSTKPDPLLNPVGVKGLGKVSMVGVAAAICNAIFHATGQRHRRLPVRIEDLLLPLNERDIACPRYGGGFMRFTKGGQHECTPGEQDGPRHRRND